MVKKLLLVSALALFSAFNAQKTHTVGKGDNPYNIAQKYGITLDEFLKLNPSVKAGVLNIGDILVVSKKPTSASSDFTKKPIVESKVSEIGTIVLQPKQTIYGITKQYHISESDLRKLNPNLDSKMKIGNEISLPLANIKKYGKDQLTETKKENDNIVETNTSDTYTIQPKDNYYRISKQFGITQAQLFALNPGLSEKGLQPGDVIKIKGTPTEETAKIAEIPRKEEKKISANSLPADDFVTYVVKDGDTVFGIINRYNIGLEDLLSLNPDLENGLKLGMTLKIKKVDPRYSKTSNDALGVVLMLPFGFDTNDSNYRTMSSEFLSGAKLAIERNASKGLKMDIKVIDAGNEKSFKNSLSQINTNNTDLIIGPFFKSNVKDVLNFVDSKKIPVIAPFANSEDLYGYSNLVIVETNDNIYAERIAKEVAQVYSNQKIYIVTDSDKANANLIQSTLKNSLKSPDIKFVNSASDIQIDKNMMTGQYAPVIAILASSDDAKGSLFTNSVIALSKQVKGMKAFSMFYHPSFEKKIDELSQANLVYLMDRKINSEGDFEKEIIADYKKKYCKTPSKYAVIGFDVVNDILSRENKNGDLFRQINKSQTQLATKFEYVRAKSNGAYINTGYRVVRLVP